AAALLTKQSFVDPAMVAVVALVGVGRRTARAAVAIAVAYVVGAAAVVGIALAATVAAGARLHEIVYALVGYRVSAGADAVSTAGSHLRGMLGAALESGLAVVIVVGIVVVFTRPRVAAGHLLVAWLGAAIVGLAAGGSYWHHYLLQLVPVAAVLGAIALTGKRW